MIKFNGQFDGANMTNSSSRLNYFDMYKYTFLKSQLSILFDILTSMLILNT